MMTRTTVAVAALCLLAGAASVQVGAQAPASPAAAGPTFAEDVAPIFYKNCTNCHRPGEIAPDVAADAQGRAALGEVDRDAGRRRARCRRGTPIPRTASS